MSPPCKSSAYDAALDALRQLADSPDASPESRSYYDLISGIVHRLAGQLDEAKADLKRSLKASPDGPWAAKVRGELAAVHLAAGEFSEAEALARAQAEELLANDRKDSLAGIYRSLARRLIEPPEPVVSPDPEAAHALLEQARMLAQGPAVRAELLLAMAEASQKAGNHQRAITEFQKYLDEHGTVDPAPDGVDPAGRDQARFGLAESQLAAGQALPARLTWESLGRDEAAKERSPDLHARALYQIAKTYNVPEPPDPQSLELGVGALRRFLDAYPSHRQSVRAAFEIGLSYLNRGRSQDALEAFRDFLAGKGFEAEGDDATRERAELSQEVAFRVGTILLAQGHVRGGHRRLPGLSRPVSQRPLLRECPAVDPRHPHSDRRAPRATEAI